MVQGVHIYATDRFSFFNSPYVGHRTGCAIDIYSSCSPIQGVVKSITKLRQDCLTLIECSENKNIYAKLLHIKPDVEIMEKVNVGDKIGTLVWSNFFNFWTDPHIHLELRNPSDAIRAKGGYSLVEIENTQIEFKKMTIDVELKPFENYMIATLPSDYCRENKGVFGLKFAEGIICGVLPHYGYGAIFKDHFKIFKCPPLDIQINNVPIKGIGLYLNLQEVNTVKLIVKPRRDFPPSGILSVRPITELY